MLHSEVMWQLESKVRLVTRGQFTFLSRCTEITIFLFANVILKAELAVATGLLDLYIMPCSTIFTLPEPCIHWSLLRGL